MIVVSTHDNIASTTGDACNMTEIMTVSLYDNDAPTASAAQPVSPYDEFVLGVGSIKQQCFEDMVLSLENACKEETGIARKLLE